jgi:hypothetical protein
MFKPGDICIVNEKADKVLTGLYRSLIGKHVMVTSSEVINDRYPIVVIHPNPDNRFEFSSQLQMREDLLTKEC